MLIVPVKEGEKIERAIKKFKKKTEKTGIVKEVRNRQFYTKPSEAKRQQELKAIHRNKMTSEE